MAFDEAERAAVYINTTKWFGASRDNGLLLECLNNGFRAANLLEHGLDGLAPQTVASQGIHSTRRQSEHVNVGNAHLTQLRKPLALAVVSLAPTRGSGPCAAAPTHSPASGSHAPRVAAPGS